MKPEDLKPYELQDISKFSPIIPLSSDILVVQRHTTNAYQVGQASVDEVVKKVTDGVYMTKGNVEEQIREIVDGKYVEEDGFDGRVEDIATDVVTEVGDVRYVQLSDYTDYGAAIERLRQRVEQLPSEIKFDIDVLDTLPSGVKIGTIKIGDKSIDLRIPGGSMSGASVTLSQTEYDHGSSAKPLPYDDKPSVSQVWVEGTLLDSTQYDVLYEKNAGTYMAFGENSIEAAVIVRGRGQYTGEIRVPYTIKFNYVQGRTGGVWRVYNGDRSKLHATLSYTGTDYWYSADGQYGTKPFAVSKDRANSRWQMTIQDTYPTKATSWFDDTSMSGTRGDGTFIFDWAES